MLSLSSFPCVRGLAENANTGHEEQRLQDALVRTGNAAFGGACSAIFIVCPSYAVPWQSSEWGRQPPQWVPPVTLPCKSPSGLC